MLILFLWSVWLYYVFLHFDKRLCDFGFTFNNWFYYIFKTSDCPWKIDWLLFSVHVNSVSTIFMTRKLLQQYIILVKSWHWDGLACKCLYLFFFLTLNIFLFFFILYKRTDVWLPQGRSIGVQRCIVILLFRNVYKEKQQDLSWQV